MIHFLQVVLSLWLAHIPFPGPGRASIGGGAGNALITSITTFGTDKNNATYCLGFSATVGAADITITDLGRWVISGNSGMHTIYLLDSGTTVLQSTTVDTSMGTPGTFIYAAITPTTIGAAQGFQVLSSETNAGDHWYDDDTTIVVTTTDAAITGGRYQASCAGAISTDISGSRTYGPVDLKDHL